MHNFSTSLKRMGTFLFVYLMLSTNAFAIDTLPRYVTIKSNEANVRVGPNRLHPVAWVYHRAGLPVEILLEFGQWRKIRDMEGEGGWIHENLLSSRRSVIIQKSEQFIYKAPKEKSEILVKAEAGTIFPLLKCEKDWCHIKIKGHKGWVKRLALWGVNPEE